MVGPGRRRSLEQAALPVPVGPTSTPSREIVPALGCAPYISSKLLLSTLPTHDIPDLFSGLGFFTLNTESKEERHNNNILLPRFKGHGATTWRIPGPTKVTHILICEPPARAYPVPTVKPSSLPSDPHQWTIGDVLWYHGEVRSESGQLVHDGGKAVVSRSWAVDCIIKGRLLSTDKYLVVGLVPSTERPARPSLLQPYPPPKLVTRTTRSGQLSSSYYPRHERLGPQLAATTCESRQGSTPHTKPYDPRLAVSSRQDATKSLAGIGVPAPTPETTPTLDSVTIERDSGPAANLSSGIARPRSPEVAIPRSVLDQKEPVTSTDSPHTDIEMENEATASTASPNQIDQNEPSCVEASYAHRPMDRESPLNCVAGQHEPALTNTPRSSIRRDFFSTVAPTPGAASSRSREEDASPLSTLPPPTPPRENMAGHPSPPLTSTAKTIDMLCTDADGRVENFSTTANDTVLPHPCFRSQYNLPYSFAIFCPESAALSLKMDLLITNLGGGEVVPLDQAAYIVVDQTPGATHLQPGDHKALAALTQLRVSRAIVSHRWIDACTTHGMFLDHRPFVVDLAAIRKEAPSPIFDGAETTTHNSKVSHRDDSAVSLSPLDDDTQDDQFSDDSGESESDGGHGSESTSYRPTSGLNARAEGRTVIKAKRSPRKLERGLRHRKKRTTIEPKDIDSFDFLLNKLKESGFAFRSRRAWLQELDTTDPRDVSWEWLFKKYQMVFETKMESLKRYNRPPLSGRRAS